MRIWVTLSIQQPPCPSKWIITLNTRKFRWCTLMAFNTKVTNYWFRTVVIWLSCMIYGDCRKHDILCVWHMLTPHFTTHNLCFKSKTFVPSCAHCSQIWKCHPQSHCSQIWECHPISYIPARTCTKYSLGLVESIESKVFNLASNGRDIWEEHSSRPGGWEKKNSGLIQGYIASIWKL